MVFKELANSYALTFIIANISKLVVQVIDKAVNLILHGLTWLRLPYNSLELCKWDNIQVDASVIIYEILESLTLLNIFDQIPLQNKVLSIKFFWEVFFFQIANKLFEVNILVVRKQYLDLLSNSLWSKLQ
jgi:hypothetical protein